MSLTHHCVWNATEKCHNTDTRQVLQRYSQLLQFLTPYCQQYTIPTELCLQQFQSTVQYLNDFDQIFTLRFTYAVRDMISLNMMQGGMLYGLGLPGIVTYSSNGIPGSGPNGTSVSGIGLPDIIQSMLVGLGYPNVNMNGIGLPGVQNLLLQSLLRVFSNSNNGLGLTDLQFLLSGLNMPDILNAYDNSMNMTELLSMLMNQSYFGGNFQENLADFDSHSAQNSTSREQGYRTDSRFGGYYQRKKRSLSPNQPDRAGNKTTFGRGSTGNGTNGSSANSSVTNTTGNMKNNTGNNFNQTSNTRPSLFNGTQYANASLILSMINLTMMDLNRFLDQSVYSLYNSNKMAACVELQQTYTCLHDNLASHIQLVEPLRGYILENTLHRLMANSMEHCQGKYFRRTHMSLVLRKPVFGVSDQV